MDFLIETITPAKAQVYLDTSNGNRPLSKPVIRSYADSIRQGKWMLNGVPIIFDENGHLIDGHHRLSAIIQAGIPMQTLVCRGVKPEAFTTIDQGRGKNLGQLLAMQNIDNYNIIASIVGGNLSMIKSGRFDTNNGAKRKGVSNTDYYYEYTRDPQGYQDAAILARTLYCRARILKASWIGTLYYYLTHTGGYQPKYVLDFFEAVCSLETSNINQADELRNYIIRNDRRDKRIKHDFLFAIVCKAWNAYVANITVKRYNFTPDKEKYPKIKINIDD